jgi:hypothetical protein
MHNLERLAILKTYFDTRRGCGHTFAMMNGVVNTDPSPVILVHSASYAQDLQKFSPKRMLRTVSWDGLERLKGLNSALVIDNAAMSNILGDALEEIRKLRAENSLLRADALGIYNK